MGGVRKRKRDKWCNYILIKIYIFKKAFGSSTPPCSSIKGALHKELKGGGSLSACSFISPWHHSYPSSSIILLECLVWSILKWTSFEKVRKAGLPFLGLSWKFLARTHSLKSSFHCLKQISRVTSTSLRWRI